MKSERVYNIINYFLYFLLLVALGVILYLLYLNWQARNLEEATRQNQAQPPVTQGQSITEETNLVESSFSSDLAAFTFSVPEDWTVEEKTEADFSIIHNAEGQNIVSIRVVKKTGSLAELPFDQYAAIAAKEEIQGYNSLEDMIEITTTDQSIGYKTTWKIQFLGGEEFVSNPITYFEHPFDPAKSIQVSLENAEYLDTYDLIIESFNFK
ncbi:hypothetical protein KJ855_02190 [Patescibacteria group bacterium]|nr:hypothetical protein [Patescibacteria group bacterium]